MNITKEQIKEWLLSRSTPENEILPLMIDVIHDCAKDLSPKWVSVDSIDLVIGARWICELNGDSIVLELDRSFPENNEPYYFWFEPYMNDLEIEWSEVTRVAPLPPTEENKI